MLAPAGTQSVGEVVYIPVFDQAVPSNEVQAVIEVMLAKNARDHMAVANVISFIGSFLGQLQVQQQPCAISISMHACHAGPGTAHLTMDEALKYGLHACVRRCPCRPRSSSMCRRKWPPRSSSPGSQLRQ